MRTTSTVLIALGVLALSACDNGPAEPEFATLELSFNGLEPLESGFHYEGWAIIDGSPLTTGKFNVDSNGGLVTTTGSRIGQRSGGAVRRFTHGHLEASEGHGGGGLDSAREGWPRAPMLLRPRLH